MSNEAARYCRAFSMRFKLDLEGNIRWDRFAVRIERRAAFPFFQRLQCRLIQTPTKRFNDPKMCDPAIQSNNTFNDHSSLNFRVSGPALWLLCRRQDSHPPNSSRCMCAVSGGIFSEEDRRENEYSLKHGFRLLSSYRTKASETIWVVTESDRSVTSLLLPSEF